jgi:hypothetical protein
MMFSSVRFATKGICVVVVGSKFNNIFSKTIHKRGRVGLLGKRLLTSIGKI